MLWDINPDFSGLFPEKREVVYVFLTRLPLVSMYCYTCYRSTCMY